MSKVHGRLVLMLAALVLTACSESKQASSTLDLTSPSISQQMIEGEWYNTETSVYPNPSIALVKFHPAGGIVMTGIDGSAQYGQYSLANDGRLTLRMAVMSRAALTVSNKESEIAAARARLLGQPARVIFDAIPGLRDQRLELQTPDMLLVFSREDTHKNQVVAATQVFQQAHQAALKAEEARKRQLAEQHRRENLRRVQSVLGVKTVLPQITGAGAKGCSGVVLAQLRRLGWRITAETSQADAILAVNLSGITYENSFWVGRYYKMRYSVQIKRASDGRVLAAFDGSERAARDGVYETCTDTADDIGDELEDIVDDLRD
jgi:hypothetical protein